MHAAYGDHVLACAGRNHATRHQARLAKLTAKNNPEHLLHHKVIAADAACPQRLVSRHPFSRHAARLRESISKPRLSTGSELFIFNRFPRCHYLVWWVRVRVTVSLGVKVRVSVEVRVRVRVCNLLGSG